MRANQSNNNGDNNNPTLGTYNLPGIMLNNLHKLSTFFFKSLFIWQRERDHKHTQKSRGSKRGRSRLHTEQGARRIWGSIPGPWDHDLSRRQMLNRLSHPGIPRFSLTILRQQGSWKKKKKTHLSMFILNRAFTLGSDKRCLNLGSTSC